MCVVVTSVVFGAFLVVLFFSRDFFQGARYLCPGVRYFFIFLLPSLCYRQKEYKAGP